MSTLFETARTITAAQVASEMYNISLKRHSSGNYTGQCLIHDDRHPSCTYFNSGNFYCHSCGATGNSIDLVSRHDCISVADAARAICEHFNLTYDDRKPDRAERDRILRKRQERAQVDANLHSIGELCIGLRKRLESKLQASSTAAEHVTVENEAANEQLIDDVYEALENKVTLERVELDINEAESDPERLRAFTTADGKRVLEQLKETRA